jgi:sec-independent protein translocase protein TatB
MFDNLGWAEIVALLLIALFIIGPERLPKMLAELGKMVRKLRRMASNATADLSKEVGTDIDITDLHPRTFIRKHVLSETDEEALKNPLKSALKDIQKHTQPLKDELDDTANAMKSKAPRRNGSRPRPDTVETEPPSRAVTSQQYDADAT